MKERIGFKMGLCGVLTALAVVTSASALAGIEKKDVDVNAEEKKIYVLKEYDGYVGVYIKGETRLPVTVTDIEISSLTAADRESVQKGLDVEGKENLMMILEDLGS